MWHALPEQERVREGLPFLSKAGREHLDGVRAVREDGALNPPRRGVTRLRRHTTAARHAVPLLAGVLLALAGLSPAVPTRVDAAPQAVTQSALDAAEAEVSAGRYRAAVERYRALLNLAGDGELAMRIAVRLAALANAAGRPDMAYEALAPRLEAPPPDIDADIVESGYELMIGAVSDLGRRDAAIGYAEALVQARARRLGEEAPATQAARLTLSIVLEKSGEAVAARRLRHTALEGLRQGDPDLHVRLLNNTAIVLQNSGHLDSAAELYDRLLAALAKGPESVALGISHFNAAILHRERRDYDSAIGHHRAAIEILEQIDGADSAETIAAIGGLGQTYAFAGRPAAALPLLRDAYGRARRALGDTDDTMLQANNLAATLRSLGEFAEAEAMDRMALDWREPNLGPAHEATLASRKNLALDLIGLGRVAEASELYHVLVETVETTRGIDHPLAADLRKERDMLAILVGGSAPDGRIFETITEAAHPTAETVRMANLLAGIAGKRGEPGAKLALHRLSARLAERYYGHLHPRTLAMLTNVARSEREAHSDKATEAYRVLEERLRLWSRREIASTSDPAVAEEVAATTRKTLGDILSFAMARAADEPAAAALFAGILLNWKAVGSLERTLLDNAARTLSGADRALLERVRALRAESLKQPRGAPDSAQRELALAEAALAQRVAGLRKLQEEHSRSYAQILTTLAPDEAVADYMIAPMNMGERGTEDRVLAMVARHDGSIWLFDLGALASLDRWMTDPSTIVGERARRALHAALIEPLEQKLSDVARLYVVPDGPLHLVPFDALIDDENRNLIETRDVRLARSGRAIVGTAQGDPTVDGGDILLVGDIDYDDVGRALPFTAAEITTIAGIADDAAFSPTVLRGDAAGEVTTRRAAKGKRILHFATHGFFMPISEREATPLWRAGVLLAPAADVRDATGDGILHAAELMDWPLEGVDLVVLSACDTAQGDRSYVEGLSGLPSALAIAGAKRSLLARWPVADRGAALFMVAFYRHLTETRSYEAALRATKLDAIEGRLHGVPADLWLAFTLIAN